MQSRNATNWLVEHSTMALVTVGVLTALLVVPFLTMEPETSASQEPTGVVFEARDAIEERFASSVFATFLIVEDRQGDVLRAEPLQEILSAENALRSDPDIGPTLFEYFDAIDEVEVVGIRTIADLIDERLPGGLSSASDQEVKQVATALLAERGGQSLGLSAETSIDKNTGLAVSPALLFPVLSDDTILGFGRQAVRLGGDTDSEEYSRSILNVVREDESTFQAWGVAIDVNLTSAEQGEAAGPFIGITILVVLVIVGLTFRSYWVLAVTGAALASLIIWLQGITNLIGLEDDLVLSLIVPIAMVSFGVDFAFHALGRYREKREEGHPPKTAFAIGMAAVAGALILALASDSAAFLSNTSAGIESIVQFGIGAAIALVAAFLLLGVATPLAVMKIEDRVGSRTRSRGRGLLSMAGAFGVSALAMTSVLMSVFILPIGGVIALGVYVVVALAIPILVSGKGEVEALVRREAGRTTVRIGNAVSAVARGRRFVLPLVGLVTVGAITLALQVETEFDVKDFFAEDTDFVVALDKLDIHGGAQAGEPADIYIDADLTDPAVVSAVSSFISDFESLDSQGFGQNSDGVIKVLPGVIGVIDDVWSSQAAQAAIAQRSGVTLTDDNADGVPDTSQQLTALYEVTREIGVPFDAQNLILTPDNVRGAIYLENGESATRLTVGLPGSRDAETIVVARDDAAPLISVFNAELESLDSGAFTVLTGGPITRQESLDAISRALQVSLPIAVSVCLLIAAAFMRSIRYGVVVIVPILVVVSWLYAFMFLFGFAINIVTATIGAVSIGIGIDFAIHFAVRYREELAERGARAAAVQAAGEGTGVALVASAASSVAGFAVLAFAPMPLFASYGLLTAVMIAMALAASLLVLPGLLMLITKDSSPSPDSNPVEMAAA